MIILMPLHLESNSCDHLGVGIFSCEETSWKTLCFKFVFCLEGKILLTLFSNQMFPSGNKKKFSGQLEPA